MLESIQFVKSVVIKPKEEVIYDPSMYAQLKQEVNRFDAVWFPWPGVFVIPSYEESASTPRQESQSEKMETVKGTSKFDEMLGRIRSMLESPQYIESVVIKPKREVICNSSSLIQLYVEVTRFGAVWIPWPGVFFFPGHQKSASPARQESSQDETRTLVTGEHSSQSAEALLNDRIDRELEKLKAHFGRKMSKSEVSESVAFLLSRGFKPEEIAVKVSIGRATIYRHILQEKPDNSVSQ
jgi:hypothetical protein